MRATVGGVRLGWAVTLAGVSVAVVGLAWWPAADPARPGPSGSAPPGQLSLPPPGEAPTTAAPVTVAQAPAQQAAPASAPAARAGMRSANGLFETDAAGRLVVDERMRLAVEALVGLHPPEALPELVAAELQGLPGPAAEQARELAQRLDAYQQAQRAAFPPGTAPLVPQEGLAELDALVALRTSYFGHEAARRMFGADEAVTRRLLQLMAEDPSTVQSMPDKAQRAQQRYDRERGATSTGP